MLLPIEYVKRAQIARNYETNSKLDSEMWHKTVNWETKNSRQMGDYLHFLGNPWKPSLAH